jgi:hypothetical protein
MPIPLGVLAVAGAGGGAAANAYELLESVILTGTQASISFSDLNTAYSSTYQHLQIRATMRGNANQNTTQIDCWFNGDNAGTSYAYHWLRAQGASLASSSGTSQSRILLQNVCPANTATANIYGALVMDILDPFETTKNKTIRSLYGNLNSDVVYLHSAFRNNTEALTSITFDPQTNDFASGTRFSLYGMRSS